MEYAINMSSGNRNISMKDAEEESFQKTEHPLVEYVHCLEYTSKNALFLFGHETNLQNILKIVYNINVDAV